MVTQIPVIPEKPLVGLFTCTSHSGAKKRRVTIGRLTNLLTFTQHTEQKQASFIIVFAPEAPKNQEIRTFTQFDPTGKTEGKRGKRNKIEPKDCSDCMGIWDRKTQSVTVA
jgi:hypothetical protein